MLHPKKTDFSPMNGIIKVIQKVVDNWADKVKHKTENKLDMGYSCGPMSY